MSWAETLDLVAAASCCVKEPYCNAAVYASAGWTSAGVFHKAPIWLFRMRWRLTLETAYATGLASSRGGYEPISTREGASGMQAYRACCFRRPSGRISAQKEGCLIPTAQVPVQLTGHP